MLDNNYKYYDGVGTSSASSGLPLQTIPKSKKTSKWEKETMDRLEQIGSSQVAKNHEFRDYYRMTEGRIVKADYQPVPEMAREIVELRQEVQLPSYIKHFDLIGMIINQIVGEFDNHQDKIRIDSLDEFAHNEYLRERDRQLKQYMQQQFDIELRVNLAMSGFPLDQEEFESEEQQQQYLEELERRKNEIIPPSEIQRSINKKFKPTIVDWAEHVYEADRKRFALTLLEKKELKDYLLTGRYFRHYRIGYDHYEPERWRPEEVFFSQDLDIEYPQDGEYVGRVFRLSASDIIQRYGHLLSIKQQEAITKSISVGGVGGEQTNSSILNPRGGNTTLNIEPLGYRTLDLTEQFQDAFDGPLGEAHFLSDTGEKKTVPYWMTGYNNGNGYIAKNISVDLREDIDVRRDTFQVTEAYWRSYQQVAYLYYEDERGIPDMVMVTEDILTDFIKDNNIKKLRSISIDTFAENPELNTIAYTYIPQIYQGKKIKGVNYGQDKDIYFDIKPLPFQLKGHSNIYDLKLPVAGIIGNSFARKIRGEQFGYNVVMNQITNLLEKEIGMFFLMDINFLPSEFKDMGDSGEMLSELRQMAKDIGLMPVDFSKKNIEGASAANAGFQKASITYAEEVQYRMTLADRYKMMAYEKIGLSPQRMGSPTKGETAEGIRQSLTSSYAQTDSIYAPFNESNRKAIELHLTVAQYTEKSGKDISIFYRKDEGDIAAMTFTDDKFHLRQLGVLPVSDSKTRKNIEQLRRVLLENNTMGSDMLEYAELFTADSMVGLVSIGRKNRLERERQEQEKHQRELELLQQEAQNLEQAEQQDFNRKEMSKERDRETELEKARISAIGAAVDNNAEAAHLNYLTKTLEQRDKANQIQLENQRQEQEFQHKQNMDEKDLGLKEQELKLKIQELKERMADRKSKERIARVNKN